MNQSSGATEAGLYLATLFEAEHADSLIEVRCPTQPWLRRFFRASAIDAVTAHVVVCAPMTDVYVGVAPRLPAEPQTGGKDAIGHVQTLWADCDTVDSIAKLAGFAPAPTIEVASGGGVHAYWVLKAPVPKLQAEIGNRRLALALGADPSAAECARVLRPPGTFNHKPERLVDGQPAPVSLRALSDTRHSWEDVVGAMPDPPTSARASARATSNITIPSVGTDPLLGIPPPVYVERLAGRQVGRDGKAFCPFHADRNTPNLHAYPEPEQGWYCFACRKGGGIIQFGALLFGIEPRGAGYHRLRREIAARLLGRAA